MTKEVQFKKRTHVGIAMRQNLADHLDKYVSLFNSTRSGIILVTLDYCFRTLDKDGVSLMTKILTEHNLYDYPADIKSDSESSTEE